MTRDGGALMERKKKCQGVFATLTVAGGTQEAFKCISAGSGYIVDRVNRWLRYKVHNSEFCYVWEIQERGAPHLHYLFGVKKGALLSEVHADLQAEWRKILIDVSNQSGVDLFEKADGGTHRNDTGAPWVALRHVNGNLRDYLSKYLSKSRSKSGSKHVFRPGRWAGISANLRRRVLANRCEIKLELPSVEEAHRALSALMAHVNPLSISVKILDKFETFDCKVVSVDVASGHSTLIARALGHLLNTGCLDKVSRLKRLLIKPDVMVPVPGG